MRWPGVRELVAAAIGFGAAALVLPRRAVEPAPIPACAPAPVALLASPLVPAHLPAGHVTPADLAPPSPGEALRRQHEAIAAQPLRAPTPADLAPPSPGERIRLENEARAKRP